MLSQGRAMVACRFDLAEVVRSIRTPATNMQKCWLYEIILITLHQKANEETDITDYKG